MKPNGAASLDHGQLLQLYDYIRYCLYAHQAATLNKLGTLRDMQHDIFLYLLQEKGVRGYNAGSRRFAYILAQYYPTYLRRYRYSSRHEVSYDKAPNLRYVVATDMTGDVLYDLNLRAALEPPVKQISTKGSYIEAIHESGLRETFSNHAEAARGLGVAPNTLFKWLKYGLPVNADNWNNSRSKFKFSLHLTSLKMLWINPFAGSRIKVTRSINQVTWDKKPAEHSDYTEEAANEYYRLMVHNESGEGLLIRLPAQKINPYIQPG